MALDTITLLLVSTGAVLAIVGYLLDDLGGVREAAMGTLVERELAHAFLEPMPPLEGGLLGPAVWPGSLFRRSRLGAYQYRDLPDPTPESTDVPPWLMRALERTDATHALDAQDQLVVFLRIPEAVQLLDWRLTWSCRPLPQDQGVLIRLSFTHGLQSSDRTLALRYSADRDLRHALCLARQDVLRIDFIERYGQRNWGHQGCRLVPVPPGVTEQLRRSLLRFGEEGGSA